MTRFVAPPITALSIAFDSAFVHDVNLPSSCNASQAFDIFFFVTDQKRFIRLKKDKKIKPSQPDNKALTCLVIIAHEGLIEVT